MYYPIPFATIGDVTTVPLTGTETGTINFQYGYGSNYSASLTTDPDALLVDRLTFNYVLNTVTATLQGLYQTGIPPFITAAENQATSYSYSAGALVLGPDGNDWYSSVSSNTATPGASPKWFLFNPTYLAPKGLIPLASVTGGTYSFASLGAGCTLTYTVSGGVINAVSAVAAGGTVYAAGDLITPNGGNYDAVIRVTTVSGGVVTAVAILYGGTGYVGGTAVGTQIATVAKQQITIAGVLTTDALFIMPNGAKLTNAASWIVGNNTTGVHTVTFKISNGSNTGTGTGVVIAQGTANSFATSIATDGATDFWTCNGTELIATGSPVSGNLTKWSGTGSLTNADLTGDVTTSGTAGTTVAKIQGTTVSGTTGSGNVVFSASPTLTGPALGTPTALVGTNITGTASSLTAGNVTTNANLAGPVTSVGNTTSIASSIALPGSPTTTTQTARDNSTKLSTTAYTDSASSTIPQNSKSADYTLVLSDGGMQIYHPSADTTARTWTIPANGAVAYPVGTAITFINDLSGGVITIAITTDTLVLAGPGTTGSRSLAAGGMATAIKMTATSWMIAGAGLT